MFDRMRSSSLSIVLGVMVVISVMGTVTGAILHGLHSATEIMADEPMTNPNGLDVSYGTYDVWPEAFTPSVALIEVALRSTTDNRVDDGDLAIVPGFKWVSVQNPQGVESGNGEFRFGDTCSIFEGVPIRAIYVSDHGQTLVEYMVPEVAYGAPCPWGTRFLIDTDDFIRFNQLYMMLMSGEEGSREIVNRELRGIDLG